MCDLPENIYSEAFLNKLHQPGPYIDLTPTCPKYYQANNKSNFTIK